MTLLTDNQRQEFASSYPDWDLDEGSITRTFRFPDFVEAMGFAWLARQTVSGQPGNCPSVSGARGPRILGAIHPA